MSPIVGTSLEYLIFSINITRQLHNRRSSLIPAYLCIFVCPRYFTYSFHNSRTVKNVNALLIPTRSGSILHTITVIVILLCKFGRSRDCVINGFTVLNIGRGTGQQENTKAKC